MIPREPLPEAELHLSSLGQSIAGTWGHYASAATTGPCTFIRGKKLLLQNQNF
jgi:hypothetical protein